MKQIRESKFSKIIAYYLMIMMFLQVTQPMQMYAVTSGPTQPEFNSFTPIGTSDMVDLSSGNFNYNIPIMDVGGYPLNLAYDSNVTMDQEASWTGLGWNLNVGQIERQVRGLPDDFRGDLGDSSDKVNYQNDLRENKTVGMNLGVNLALVGNDSFGFNAGVGLGVESNNYEGVSFKPSFGIGFELGDQVSVGMNFSSSIDEGATVTPSLGLSAKSGAQREGTVTSLKGSASLGFNSRKGVENLNLSASVSQKALRAEHKEMFNETGSEKVGIGGGGNSGSISFNDQSFTPSKRIGFENTNFSFNGALGGEVFGVEGQVQVTGYGSYQKIAEAYKNRNENAFGYENTQYKKNLSGVLDFNRENDRVVNKNTTALPLTNYTYDLYNIEGQGVSGQFRPFRSQVGSLYNDYVVDYGESNNFGLEIGLGELVHGSGDMKSAPSVSWTGPWIRNNNVLPYFNENSSINKLDYETSTFKMVGGMIVDPEQSIYNNKIYQTKAIRIGIKGGNKNSATIPIYYNNVDGSNLEGTNPVTQIKRSKRYLRSQLIQKVTVKEAARDPLISINENTTVNNITKYHHTAGIKVLQTDGSTYVYGNTAYNIKKVEATFDVSAQTGYNSTGLVTYNGADGIISGNSTDNSDKFLNKITTPPYAHSYMLSSVLSSDYQDVDNNGPTINDLGSFTKFEYKTFKFGSNHDKNYQWRIPFEGNKATYNEGLISKKDDQKGNYLYGVKQLVYLTKIVTKTHVAFFDLGDRNDALGVDGEEGGKGVGRMQRLESIRLYSLPEVTDSNGQIVDPLISGSGVKPIKTAHFVYNYNLCPGIPNNIANTVGGSISASNNGGKLTLEKVYFTYRDSNMGMYTPYVFNYGIALYSDGTLIPDPIKNPKYDMKGFDVWGNYKKNAANSGDINTPLSNTEFPYVEQDMTDPSVDNPNNNVQAWTLKSINLPSGGEIKIETESDNYQYVQNKKAMQMFKVIGAGDTPDQKEITDNHLYNEDSHKKYLYVKLAHGDVVSGIDPSERRQWFIDNYLGINYDKPIQFKFMLNMGEEGGNQYEYVSGYFRIEEALKSGVEINVRYDDEQGTVAAIPLLFLGRGDGGSEVNPIAKAGWGFGRTYLNRIMYGTAEDPTQTDFASLVESLRGSIQEIKNIFTGPNKALQNKGRARAFKPKSWVRLENPNGKKFGGGLRVKSIKLSDKWNDMLSLGGGTNNADMEYGQTYSYEDDITHKSYGVATFEPNSCAENPLVEPMYSNAGSTYADRIAAPRESNYAEKPFGENFFPAARVTYSKVSVKNIDPTPIAGREVKKHATGKVVTDFWTSYDFPTKVDYTNLGVINDLVPNTIIGSLIKLGNVRVRNHLTMSQGYSIETNDMNGKTRMQTIYDVRGNTISSVEYKYNVDEKGNLDNNLTTIDAKGKVAKKLIGLDYDMINDFNESYAATTTTGFDANVATFVIVAIPILVPAIIPKKSFNENQLRTAVTTKHIHKTGILIEKIATDLGATVSTKNLAWDASSGEVLLTQTANEYGDPYYSFTYPAYWMYEGMGPASTNIGIEGELKIIKSCTIDPRPYFRVMNPEHMTDALTDISPYFHPGDELMLEEKSHPNVSLKAWVLGLNNTKDGLLLMDKDGNYLDNCGTNLTAYRFKIVRSGNRNLQSASMASVTSMTNPLKDKYLSNGTTPGTDGIPDTLDQNSFIFDQSSSFNPRIVNSSAVVYNDFWKPQNDIVAFAYPTLPGVNPDVSGEVPHPFQLNYNPYLWNTKGNWRAEKSYAYLTGRNASKGQINNPRNEGFYNRFAPFYQLSNGVWTIVNTNWTYASSVTKFSPFGMELENKDALNRYSSALYGYQNKLPMAVASNAKYNEIGFEGFEETQNAPKKHFVFSGANNYTYVPVTISNTESHSGKRSVKVTATTPVKLVRKLKPLVTIATPRVCTFTCSELINIDYDSRNYSPHQQITDNGYNIYYNKFKLSTDCISIKISGTSASGPHGNYEFSPDPQNSNNVYLKIYGAVDTQYINQPGYATPLLVFNIPIVVEGQTLILKYTYPTSDVPNPDNPGYHINSLGELGCQ